MNTHPIRAVFDCVVFLQGAGRRQGPCRRCLELVDQDRVGLYLSPLVLEEIADVLTRPVLLQKFPCFRLEDTDLLMQSLSAKATVCPNVPHIFSLPRDPDDEPYIDLAIVADAEFLVSWNDRHLAYLMRRDTGEELCRRYPLKIVSPPGFLAAVKLAQIP